LALDGGVWSTQTPAALSPGKIPCTHGTGDCVVLRASLDVCGKCRPQRSP